MPPLDCLILFHLCDQIAATVQPTNEKAQIHRLPPDPNCYRVPAQSSPTPPKLHVEDPNSPIEHSIDVGLGLAASTRPGYAGVGQGKDLCTVGFC